MRLSSLRPPAALAVAALVAAVLPAVPALASARTGAAALSTFTSAQASSFRVLPGTPALAPRYAGTTPVSRAVRAAQAARLTHGSTAAAPRSVWKVDYDAGFQADPLARSEFQRAVDTWAAALGSSVPITVDARFQALGPGVLGQAGPGAVVTDGKLDYPVALGNAKTGRDLDPRSSSRPGYDIVAKFPNNNDRIYYGTGPVPSDKYDFYSTVLHELGHGLGFVSSMEYGEATGSGYYGDGTATTRVFGFDKVLTLGSGTGSTDLVSLPNGSTRLGAALLSDDLYWRGAQGVAANGGVRPKLYAPSPYEEGSSISHLDERTYPAGTANALMTPAGDPGEVNAEIGPIVLGMFADIGWSVSRSGAPSPSPSPSSPPVLQPGAASRFTPVTPRRLLDTRTGLGLGGHAVRLGDDATVDLVAAGADTGVPADATAVVLNVTAVAATRNTDVRVYPKPTGSAVPTVSNINLSARQTRAGVVTVPLGADGSVRLRNEDGQVSLLADLAGYYSPNGQSAFHPVAPTRLLDTRTQETRKLGPGATLDLQVAGVGSVPASASAVVLNVTGVAPTASTDLAVYPATSSTDKPSTSNVNLVPGVPVPNLVVVKTGDGGRVRIRNSSGSTAVLVDLSGWYDAAAPGGQLFRAVSPVRLFDSREETDPSLRRLGAGGIGGFSMTRNGGVPATATAVLLNVTGVAAAGSTDLRVYPYAKGSSSFPVVSNLNLGTGSTNADAVVVGLGDDGAVLFRNQSSTVAVLSDLAGYFAP